jgi:hypothetical protein
MTTPTATIFLPYHALDDVILRGTRAAQPAAAAVVPGTLYSVTDEGYRVERSDGAAWAIYVAGGALGSVYPFRATTTAQTASDPGSGYLKWNTVAQTTATTLYFDWLTSDGLDVHLIFQLMTPPSRFLVQDADLAVQYQLWALTAPAINHPDWFEVPVTLVGSGGATFSNNQRLAVVR